MIDRFWWITRSALETLIIAAFLNLSIYISERLFFIVIRIDEHSIFLTGLEIVVIFIIIILLSLFITNLIYNLIYKYKRKRINKINLIVESIILAALESFTFLIIFYIIYLFCYTIKIISLTISNLLLLIFIIYLTVFFTNTILNIIFRTLEKKPIKLYF